MKHDIARCLLIARLATLALFALCFAQLPVSAQHSGTHVLYQDVFIPPVGLVPSESLRFTLFNAGGTPVRAQVRSYHSGGILVALGDGSVRAGAFQTFDFKRNDIPLPGEVGTGRIQLSGSVRLTFSEAITPVTVSMETITDGTSNTVFIAEILPAAGGSEYDVATGNRKKIALMGIVPDQTLRVSLLNPLVPGAESQSKSVNGHIKIFDRNGDLIAQSPELAIPPGEFRFFDFNRYALPLSGEPGTGRLQVRAAVSGTFTLTFNGQTTGVPVLASWELISNATGKTEVGVFDPATSNWYLRNSNSQ